MYGMRANAIQIDVQRYEQRVSGVSELSVDEMRLLMVMRTLEAVFGHEAYTKKSWKSYRVKKKGIKVGSTISRRIPWEMANEQMSIV